ncbi:hypothetical protein [Xanthomonas campestris]|uniref:hypothetical protein n=1 Tax=Xanthomonas campestris TaxID=339 RepID=UPI002367B4E6|nr:hypothetical protein [Xanthomonas campestris]
MSQVIDLPGGNAGKPQGQVDLSVGGVRFARPMRGPDARKAAGLGFDHCAEGIVAQCSLLLQMKANASEQFVGQSFIEHGALGSGSLNRIVAKRKPAGMWCQCAVPALARIGWANY